MPKLIKLNKKNNDFQHIEVIKRNRYKRHKYQKIFIEGVRNINNAIKYDWRIESFIYPENKKLSKWATDIISNSKADFHYSLTNELITDLSDKEDVSEIMAIAKTKSYDFNKIELKDDLLVAIFDRPSNPGNLGTIIRSCDSFKVDALIITGHSVDLFDPATIKSSVGSFFNLPIFVLESHESIKPLFDLLKSKNISAQIVGTTARTDKLIEDVDFTKATFFVIGNETSGMSHSYKNLCDTSIKIPIYGNATSLNVACATSIILYEIDRQRRHRI